MFWEEIEVKKFLNNLGEEVVTILLTPIIIIVAVFTAIMQPFFYIRYKFSAYYKASKKPYEFFMNFDFVNLYNEFIVKNTGYEYHQNGAFEYFTKDSDVLFYCDICAENIMFVYKDDGWYVEDFSEDYEERVIEKYSLSEFATEQFKIAKAEHKSLNPKLIVSHHAFDDDEIDKAKECPYFYFAEL